MIAAGQQVCLGNISDGLPAYVAGPVPCDALNTVPYRSRWGASSYTGPAEQPSRTTAEQGRTEGWVQRLWRWVTSE